MDEGITKKEVSKEACDSWINEVESDAGVVEIDVLKNCCTKPVENINLSDTYTRLVYVHIYRVVKKTED